MTADPAATLQRALQEAIALLKSGDERAEGFLAQAVDAFPGSAEAWGLWSGAALQAGREAAAGERVERAILLNPEQPHYHLNLGLIREGQGRLAEAEQAMEQALALNPDLAGAHFSLGNLRRARNDREGAIEHLTRAIGLDPNHAPALYNLGLNLSDAGRPEQAEEPLLRAIQIDPALIPALRLLAMLYQDQKRFEEARRLIERALELAPDSPELLNDLGAVLRSMERLDEATAFYQRAVEIDPRFLPGLINLAQILERRNLADRAAAIVARGFALAPDNHRLQLVAAKLDRRRKAIAEAIDRLEGTGEHPDEPDWRLAKHFELGRLHDLNGDPDRAFNAFARANALSAARQAPEALSALRREFIEQIQSHRQWIAEPAWIPSWTPARDAWSQAGKGLAFLVGFPRSGTTLLDQILDSHPAIQTMEERPAVFHMRLAFEKTFDGAPRDALAQLTPAQAAQLRTLYFQEVARHIERRPDALFIDKFPLNLTEILLLKRVFPSARFVLALRHPLDVCLSCFMQDFQINRAMAHFLSLEGTANLYAEAMALWEQAVDLLAVESHAIRYEDLLVDFQPQVERLLAFLGLSWDPAVTHHAEHAQRRAALKTPSFDQVTRPLYHDARYRWRRYAKQLEPIRPTLAPFIERFGYAEI